MKTQKGKAKTDPAPAPAAKSAQEQPANEEPQKVNGAVKERFQLSFDLNADGSPDLSSMREKTRERAKQFFGDPKIAEAFGAKAVTEASTPAVDFFPIPPGRKYSPIIGSMYSTLGMIENFVAQKMGKIPAPIAARVFEYTEAEKELLAPYTARVLNKWAPLWLIKYQDEIALGNLLLTITITKCQMAAMLTAQMNPAPAPAAPTTTGEEGKTPQPN